MNLLRKFSKIMISLEERREIEKMLKEGFKQSEIALKLSRHWKTISREVATNGGRLLYNALDAHNRKLKHLERRQKIPIHSPLTEDQISIIEKGIKNGLSKYNIRKQAGIGAKRCIEYFKKNHPEYKSKYASGLPALENRIESLEMQIEIIIEQLRSLNDRSK